MLPEVQSLLIVQDRDQKIHALRQELAKIPKDRARAEAQLDSDKQAVMAAKKAAQENELAMKSLELDIKTRKDSIEKLQVQQFETKKNEEFVSIGNDIQRYTEMVDELETNELELMENHDGLEETHAKAVAQLKASSAEIADDLEAFVTKAAELEARLAEVEPERATLTQKVDGSLLALYERLLKSKGIDPVVPLKGAQCGGCHMKVTQTTVVNVQSEKAPAQCENCGRFLYSI